MDAALMRHKIKEHLFMRAYERLLQYATVHTTSNPQSGTHPSAACEFDLAKLLVEELKALGVEDARVDENCYVYGTVPASEGYENAPALGLIAHMDTVDDAPGENVKPILHENYNGGDVTLPATGAVMTVEKFPFLAQLKGETLITSDGTTLLGADDKSGIAEIFTAVEMVLNEKRPHGKLCIAITPDEEIGEGALLFDIPGFGADFAYTVDGGDVGGIEYENFNAASATVTVHGFSVHPGSAKDKMINASNVAMEYHMALPVMARPETTEGREGFYHLCQMCGDVNEAKLGYILRDHDAEKLEAKKRNMECMAEWLNGKYGAGTVTVEIRDSYRNMIEKILPHFHLVETAREAIRMAGMEPEEVPVRGGTDGAVLSWKGLPCPNLGTGGFNYHGVFECTTAERMDRATEVLLNIIALYSKKESEKKPAKCCKKANKE
jgi:tripeptide aminopeptidase